MSKTTEKWLSLLDSEVAKMFEANSLRYYGKHFMERSYDSVADMLAGAFPWSETPEGYHFWERECKNAKILHGN